MFEWFFIAQLLGFVCFVSGLVRLQLKEHKSIIFCDMPICTLWSLHYFIIGGTSGFIINSLAVIRAFLRCFFSKAVYTYATIIILGLIWCLCLFFYQGYYSLLPPLASSIFTYGMLSESRKRLSNCIIVHNLLWVAYGVCLLSPMSCLSPATGIISCLIGKYRHESFLK